MGSGGAGLAHECPEHLPMVWAPGVRIAGAPGARKTPSLGGFQALSLCSPAPPAPPVPCSPHAELSPSARFGSGCTRSAPRSSPLTGRGGFSKPASEGTGGENEWKTTRLLIPRLLRKRPERPEQAAAVPPSLPKSHPALAWRGAAWPWHSPGGTSHRAVLLRSHAAGQSPSGSAAPPAAGLGLRLRLAELGGSRRSVGAATCRGRAPARGLLQSQAAELISHLGKPWGQREGDPGGWG